MYFFYIDLKTKRICQRHKNKSKRNRLPRHNTQSKKDTYQPYKKANDKSLYMHTSSNHPLRISEQIQESINRRLSNNSSNETIFSEAKKI